MGIRIFCSAVLALSMTVAGSTAVHAQAVSGQGTWETTLQARDIGNTGTTNAFYDTDLNVTWLRDMNANGPMSWGPVTNWVGSFSIGGVSDWRLPISAVCSGYDCTNSEMGHLFYTELGNAAGSLTNTGDFQNVQAGVYWSGTGGAPFNPRSGGATGDLEAPYYGMNMWTYKPSIGLQYTAQPSSGMALYAMAVHSGDVGSAVTPVPEPETYAMLLTGLGLVGAAVRRRNSGSASRGTPCES